MRGGRRRRRRRRGEQEEEDEEEEEGRALVVRQLAVVCEYSMYVRAFAVWMCMHGTVRV